jgi:superfamily II DNA/RNA helicase
VIFSEWTTMTMLIGKHLSEMGISFVELSGKIPVTKRQALIDEFTTNPQCKVFLSTDAGGTGLNLQAADCVINFELPWNPARLNQRVGRVSRIGQQSSCINVVNLIAKGSIEEKIYAGIQLKTDLFKGVFDGEGNAVEFSREKRTEMLNRLRELMGEEPELVVGEGRAPEEIPEDTPHFLNPEVLAEKGEVDYADEEPEMPAAAEPEVEDGGAAEGQARSSGHEPAPPQSPEKMEQVLNQGMSFISGLLEMATGKKIEPVDGDGRLLRIDTATGEVTMKFKLPGFS